MSLGSHQRTIGATQTWTTPKWILDALGPFDTDPCAADPRPWDCAYASFTVRGLERPWSGRTWLNLPFHRYEVARWVRKLAEHDHGTALLHARTEAEWFEPVWQKATALLFLADRIHFHYPDGRRAEANSGAPACLAAFGQADADALKQSGIGGYFVSRWEAAPRRRTAISSRLR